MPVSTFYSSKEREPIASRTAGSILFKRARPDQGRRTSDQGLGGWWNGSPAWPGRAHPWTASDWGSFDTLVIVLARASAILHFVTRPINRNHASEHECHSDLRLVIGQPIGNP